MPYKAIIECPIEEWWGIDDLLEGAPLDTKQKEIIELLMEDTSALLDNATWKVVQVSGTVAGLSEAVESAGSSPPGPNSEPVPASIATKGM